MKIRTLFMLAAVTIFTASLGASLIFFQAQVATNIQGRFFSEARSICALLPLYQDQCQSLPENLPLHRRTDLAAATEKLAEASHNRINIRYAARSPRNKSYLANPEDLQLIDFFTSNRDSSERCQLLDQNGKLLRYSQPIFYQSSCYDCHHKQEMTTDENSAPAVVIIEVPYSSLTDEKKGKFLSLAIINSSGYLAAFVCLFIMLYFTVLKKLHSLSIAAKKLEQGNYSGISLPYYDQSNNELNLLTNAFSEMKTAVETRETLLKGKNRQIYSMFHNHQSIMFLIDAQNYKIIDANLAAEQFYAMSQDNLKMKSFFGLHAIEQEEMSELFAPCLSGKRTRVFLSYNRVEELCYLELRLSPVNVDNQACLFLIIHDITEQKKAENQIKKEHQFFQTVIDNMVDPVLVLDTQRHIKKANRAAKALAQGKLEENDNICCYQAVQSTNFPCDSTTLACPVYKVLKTGKPASVVRHIESSNKTFEIQASPYFDDYGDIAGIIESFRDITQRLEVEQSLIENERKVYDLTHYDELTGLPNRSVLIDRLNQAIYRALYDNRTIALLCLNLDRFKKINDTLGHHVGDLLLQEVASRLQYFSDEHATLARNSGSEFFLLLEDTQSDEVLTIAHDITANIKESVFADNHELLPSCSLGIAFFPDHADNSSDLMAKADIAMRIAKKELGGNGFCVYEYRQDEIAPESLRLEANLKYAIDSGELFLQYQPQFSLQDDTLVGLEALVRWQHPKEGLISPAAFIPLAEETGLIHELGAWVLRQACQQITTWQKQGVNVVPIAVNISSIQMKKSNFISLLDQCIEDFDLDTSLIELELTESAIMDRLETSMETLRAIRSRGFKLAIDDFGTGYSSLSYLKSFPFSKLKVDRSFVMDLENDENDAAIIEAIISMGKSLGLKTIAEGVENEVQRDYLIQRGCDEVQGFLYSRPLAAEAVFNTYLKLRP